MSTLPTGKTSRFNYFNHLIIKHVFRVFDSHNSNIHIYLSDESSMTICAENVICVTHPDDPAYDEAI